MDDREIIKQITLNAPTTVMKRNVISADFFRQYPELRPDIIVDQIANQIVVELSTILQGETLEKVEFKYPEDWFQAVKERFFPKWLLKRYPVKYITKCLEARAVYPRLSLKNQEHKLLFLEDGKFLNGNRRKNRY